MSRPLVLALSMCLASCAAQPASPPSSAATPPPPHLAPEERGTRILDADAAAKLLAADGVTLQWIGWNQRGQVNVRRDGDTIRLTGSQVAPDGPGRLFLDGEIREIGAGYFDFDGLIRITDTPDTGRRCEADKRWHFEITQNRPYWRLREFEWCDELTDYVDIYLAGTMP